MKEKRYIAVPCERELVTAIQEGCRRSGLKMGPEAAMRLRKAYRVGPYAAASKRRRAR